MKKQYDVYWTAQYSTVIEIEYNEGLSKEEINELISDEVCNIDPEPDTSNCYVSESFEVIKIEKLD